MKNQEVTRFVEKVLKNASSSFLNSNLIFGGEVILKKLFNKKIIGDDYLSIGFKNIALTRYNINRVLKDILDNKCVIKSINPFDDRFIVYVECDTLLFKISIYDVTDKYDGMIFSYLIGKNEKYLINIYAYDEFVAIYFIRLINGADEVCNNFYAMYEFLTNVIPSSYHVNYLINKNCSDIRNLREKVNDLIKYKENWEVFSKKYRLGNVISFDDLYKLITGILKITMF